ncbi:MAG: NB-ARC domain-containing protein [Aggregatilineales bacterium]
MPQQLDAALVRIFSTGDIPVGAGVLVDFRSVLTCAHVVREALKLGNKSPIEAPDGEISLDFPFIAPGQYLTVRVNAELWDSSCDLAILHLAPPDKAIAQAFLDLTANQLVGHKFRVRGFPGDARNGAGARGIIGEKVGDGYELEREGELHLIEPGFSGSPVWDETSGGVVGIVNRTLEATRADLGYMIPLDVIREFWADVPTRPLSETGQAPFMAGPFPDGFVDRPAEFEPLVKALIDTTRGAVAITAALKGAGGYGKTTLARAICHDLRVRSAFNDGILWVELGETVSDNQLLEKVLDLIRELTGARPAVSSPESAPGELRTAIGNRHVLVVVDDVWETDHLKLFLNLGKNAATLITTRIDSILPAESIRQNLDAMDADQALALLRYGLPVGEDATLSALATRLGNWPMLLNLANKALYDQTKHDETLLNALRDVN